MQNVKDLRKQEKHIYSRKKGGLIEPDTRELTCYYREPRECLFQARDMTAMKAHLAEEFDAMCERKRIAAERRAKIEAQLARNRARQAEMEAQRKAQQQPEVEII